MRLTKLDIVGFKSFARKTELIFSGGITAVIGPNGSGKSNIADAVRWVLGEQSVKALRGTKMEDVIFGGTQQKKALSYCEVTLTFDNSDHLLPIDFEEVAITRRVYRSGDSEYCINKANCRLKDINELFHDTGIGRDGYSIIGQGRVDDILSNKSGDRRTALEEAAGVMRFRVRKEEAERKLGHTQKNLERIGDILTELGARLAPLEEQSRTARKYLQLRDELKDDEVNVFLLQTDRIKERLEAAAQLISELKQQEVEAGEHEQALLSECASYELRMQTLDNTISETQRRLIELLSTVENRVGECNVLIERRDNGKTERKRLMAQRETLTQRKQALVEEIKRIDGDETNEQSLKELDGELSRQTGELTALEENITADEASLEAMKAAIIEAMNRLSDAKSLIAHFDAMHSAFLERMHAVEASQETVKRSIEGFQKELTEAEEALSNQTSDCKRLEQELINSQHEQSEAVAAQSRQQRTLQEQNARLVSMQSRLTALNELAANREGYFESIRHLMRDAKSNATLSKSIVGIVAELIRVPKEYEQAISMTMGASLQNVISPTAEDAKYVIDYLRRNEYGRATILPLNLLRFSRVSEQERRMVQGEGVIGIASDLIHYEPSIETAIQFLLGRTVIVKDLNSGIRLKRRTGNSFYIATLEGDTIATSGTMSGGSQKKRQFSLLGREREIQELTAALKKGEQEKKQLLLQSEEQARSIALYGVQVESLRTALQEHRINEIRQREHVDIIARDLATAKEQLDRLRAEAQTIEENIADLIRDRDEADRTQSGIEAGNAASREDVVLAQKALSSLRTKRDTLMETISEVRIRRMALVKEQDATERERQRLIREGMTAEQELTSLGEALLAIEEQVGACEARLAEMQTEVESVQGDATEQQKAQQAFEDERAGIAERLTERRARREALLVEARDRAERMHKQELATNRLEMELSSMQNHIWEEYTLTYENALPFRREISLAQTNARISALKAEIRDLGEINLSSIEDYRTVSERHSSFAIQHEDLVKAKGDLERMIVELTATMEREFKTKFELIRKNFNEVFVELFGGGQAELRLADPKDALNCDIDIVAQPPGKKLQLLSLLSGGERAMTAIALLFAMLRLKPPAFCVLDEIESSLDEANVARFADYLKVYSDQTQFIVITHRRGSMAVCDTLYGVSMEERGISKVVSARFDEETD